MFGGILASVVLVAAMFGMLKWKSEIFDKSMMIGVSISILLLWVIPWGILVICPLILALSFASPAAREEWSKFKNRRIAIGIIFLLMLNSLGFYPVSEPSAPEEWGKPLFYDNPDAAAVVFEVNECRKQFGDYYIRVIAFDSSHGWESIKLSFIVNRPKDEPGFHVSREEVKGRSMRYTIKSYATEKPEGRRY